MSPPRVLADEMVGSLARYLRILGCDTTYARGWTDDEIVRRAKVEDRIVVTRDWRLSERAAKAVLLTSTRLEDQVRATWQALPELSTEIRFERCTLCNGELAADPRVGPGRPEDGIPWDRVEKGLPLFRCRDCGHVYWQGSHTEEIRRRLRAWAAEAE